MGQYTSYWLYQKYEQRGEQDFIPSYPNEYSINGGGTMPLIVKEENDTECGYDPPVEPIYDWVRSDETTCIYSEDPITGYRWAKTNDTVCVEDAPTPYESQYLTLVPLEDGTIKFMISSGNTKYYYSNDSGATWVTGNSSTSIHTTAGRKVMFKGELRQAQQGQGVGQFVTPANTYPSGTYDVEGNIMSLLYGDNFVGKETLSSSSHQWIFYILFGRLNMQLQSFIKIKSAENLILPATTLAKNCYNKMFWGCTSLEKAPALPATTLENSCYAYMFSNCRSLNYIKCLATNISASYCLSDWVYGVPATGTFVTPASTEWSTGDSGIPSGWTRVDA